LASQPSAMRRLPAVAAAPAAFSEGGPFQARTLSANKLQTNGCFRERERLQHTAEPADHVEHNCRLCAAGHPGCLLNRPRGMLPVASSP